jgi:hypothetical protein
MYYNNCKYRFVFFYTAVKFIEVSDHLRAMSLIEEAARFKLKPYVTEAAGLNIFSYPGTREEFADSLVNLGASGCLMRFALRFEGTTINLDLLFYLVDVVRTKDDAVIFYSPESRVLEMKIIQR